MEPMKDLFDLSDRTALVTGGSRGVGRAVALLLARAGARVGVGYRGNHAAAAETVQLIEAAGGEAWSEAADLSVAEGADRLFERVDREFGGLDFFVGNAGVWPVEGRAIAEMSDDQWHHTVRSNLDSIFFSCRAAAKRMRDGGSLILVSSTAGQRGEAFHGDYAATKGALISLVKGFCIELAPRDVRVNAIAPGWIDTEMAAPAFEGENRAKIAAGIPLGRIATAEDVAGPIFFLCTPLARHITGEIINVNGGAVLVG